MSDDLRARIDRAISRVPAARAADEVLAEIGRTHLLVDHATATAIRAFLLRVGNEGPWFGSDGWELVAAWRGDVNDQRPTVTCPHCGGEGITRWYEWDAEHGGLEEDECPVCEGTGRVPEVEHEG